MNQINRLQPWLNEGYALFALQGPKGLKIETISKLVNKNKSSFYHHFVDLDVFTELLLAHHQKRAKKIAERAALCQNIVPDFIQLLLDVKLDLLFNRQLRINRQKPGFRTCFEKANKPVEMAFLNIWAKALGLDDRKHVSEIILNLTVENFYLQITEETLTYEWILDYFNEIILIVKELYKAN